MTIEEFDNLHDAIQLLKNRKSLSDEEVIKMIATIAAISAWKTMTSKMIPKGQVIIGIGEPFPALKKIKI